MTMTYCPMENAEGEVDDVATRKYGDQYLHDITSETAAERRLKRLALAEFSQTTPARSYVQLGVNHA